MRWLSLPINLRFIHIILIDLDHLFKGVSFEQVVTQGYIGKAQTEHGPSPH